MRDPHRSPAAALLDADGARTTSPGDAAETTLLWSSSEGQVSNATAFILAVLLCWLVLPVIYAAYRCLRTSFHRYELTDQRLIERSGILVKRIETLELYRVKDISVDSTLAQSLFGRGQVILQTTDSTSPQLLIQAVAGPDQVSQLIRNQVERCRIARGVRAFDF
ncbi:PH domain-containing protein [Variovorax sp. ZS18.2.2]|uniref:PH domain-containing protein n=1 Tax=Variovorax sp. ZS18.2.2 TaxID=2971255 RepID=UPI0021510858|nr:PH domain-containing protein [Variovorax sp. ZS18.2.2]MCR6481005.1 PH domain-containing protein [Variovorax sp. ZS18.2.2]